MTRPFLRHYLEMLAAMAAGMLVLEPVRMLASAALGWSTLLDRTEPLAMAMATEMSIGMAVWMRFRGHGGTPILEMCLAMFAPFLLLFLPLWAGLMGRDGVMLAGHLLMLPVMALVMLRRREEYGGRPVRSPEAPSAVTHVRDGG